MIKDSYIASEALFAVACESVLVAANVAQTPIARAGRESKQKTVPPGHQRNESTGPAPLRATHRRRSLRHRYYVVCIYVYVYMYVYVYVYVYVKCGMWNVVCGMWYVDLGNLGF